MHRLYASHQPNYGILDVNTTEPKHIWEIFQLHKEIRIKCNSGGKYNKENIVT